MKFPLNSSRESISKLSDCFFQAQSLKFFVENDHPRSTKVWAFWSKAFAAIASASCTAATGTS